MSYWAQKRKSFYFFIFVLFLGGGVILPAYFLLYRPPTCFDGKQNGGERGIDCGGKCVKLCPSQYLEPNIIWARAIKVKQNIYSALAYIENPNIDAGADSISYIFRIKDKEGILIYERKGKTSIPPNKFFAVFEDGISTGEKIPAEVFFEFTSNALWRKQDNKESGISVSRKEISNEEKSPRIDATLENKTLQHIFNVEVVAIVYDMDDNALGFSRTFIDRFDKEGTQNITFTWPRPFDGIVARIEIIPRVYTMIDIKNSL